MGLSLGDFIDWIKGQESEGITSFPLPLEEAPSDGENGRPAAFLPNEVYLEVRVRQIWLTKERERWREFQPFAAVVTEFIHKGETRALPALLGSSELGAKLSLIGADDAVEIRNIRVAGPTPYEGDDVSILLALFRTETENWMSRTLNAVEGIAQAVGVPALIAAKPVADAVIAAVTQFLGDEKLELQCGQYQSWSSAEDPAQANANELSPMHYVVMRRPVKESGANPGKGFAVRDGRLHAQDGDEHKPYTKHDFVLLSIEPRRLRDDYKKLEFYGLWQQTQAHVIEGDLAAAERAWRRTAGALYSDELTGPQQQALYAEYKARYDQLLDRFAQADALAVRTSAGQLKEAELDEQDPAEILLAPLQ